MNEFLKKQLDLQYFHDHGYIRKNCSKCGAYFWTLDSTMEECGDQPCVPFHFIGNPLGKKKLTLREVRDAFLSYFEQHNHTRLYYPKTGERYPVVARWRNDIYLTIASIADFQPHVTSGEVPPPANPLAISQPCIRLNDLDEVGKSGRHLTMFEMMGHHAFNKNIDEIYFKEKTVAYCDDFFVKKIGIPREKITYKEQLWHGGGNAGPCLEVLAGGLEIATLVFMNMKEAEGGKYKIGNETYEQNPLNIVDTGYGLERIAWLTQGTKTVYEAVFPQVIDWIRKQTASDADERLVMSLADHTKSLAFMLGDGIVPSNVKSGYLARLLIRRCLRFIEQLNISRPLEEIIDLHINRLQHDFSSLVNQREQIHDMIQTETKRYHETLQKGKNMVKRLLAEKKEIDNDTLIRLYDTHGMPPKIVQSIAEKQNVTVTIPENFESMVADLHSQEEKQTKKDEKKRNLPETNPLYYNDHYRKEFDATVVWTEQVDDKTVAIFDQTTFYPEGGGQPGDQGTIITDAGDTLEVETVTKENNAILHHINGSISNGDKIHGQINWKRRYQIMKHHTGTHVVNGALQHVLGDHVWQAGSQLAVKNARFDYAHYKSLSDKE
ncbi:MAG: alanine--tRNA ligase, partial [Candidatus Thermoplasmatota archaeon]|nr:alanine--tRNA ligase [Candidatus Thermoplasmatota archaeon]